MELTTLGVQNGGDTGLDLYVDDNGQAHWRRQPDVQSPTVRNAAKDTTVTFYRAGTYTFKVAVTNSSLRASTSSVNVIVNQSLTSISVDPRLADLNVGDSQDFAATGYDQFGVAMASQPSFTWTATYGHDQQRGAFQVAQCPRLGYRDRRQRQRHRRQFGFGLPAAHNRHNGLGFGGRRGLVRA